LVIKNVTRRNNLFRTYVLDQNHKSSRSSDVRLSRVYIFYQTFVQLPDNECRLGLKCYYIIAQRTRGILMSSHSSIAFLIFLIFNCNKNRVRYVGKSKLLWKLFELYYKIGQQIRLKRLFLFIKCLLCIFILSSQNKKKKLNSFYVDKLTNKSILFRHK